MTYGQRNWQESRRSQRILLQIDIQVCWTPAGEQPITEDTKTIEVNAHGALIALALRVKPGNRISVRNWGTARNTDFRVVHVRERPGAKKEVGIEMALPDGSFWGVAFPPEDWKPS